MYYNWSDRPSFRFFQLVLTSGSNPRFHLEEQQFVSTPKSYPRNAVYASRMFSHPWTDQEAPASSSTGGGGGGGGGGEGGTPDKDNESGTAAVSSALRRVRLLNDHLKERSRRLLEAKKGGGGRGAHGGKGEGGGGGGGGGDGEDEGEGGGGGEFGSFDFNVALINRMEPLEERPDLKLEPTFGQDR